ncbi:hypothetical protein BUALT_Bualt10G0069500 [Buddleja alternifolia]|uniref:Uncharacterized protein n=1 Tax=Buddleja alternifolia TaxID=168488 RepID=A0AAV6WXF1_9LAMI|nr:hypothetical protein BUALT_Bualt10G0069500 [Buddleja alternifolia]
MTSGALKWNKQDRNTISAFSFLNILMAVFQIQLHNNCSSCKKMGCNIETDGSIPNTIAITTIQVVKKGVATLECTAKFNDEAHLPFITKSKTILRPGEVELAIVKKWVATAGYIEKSNDEAHSPFIRKSKTILHPGEVNRIRELPHNCNIVAAHTNSPDVFIWDVRTQLNQHIVGVKASKPDLSLTGHKDNAEFALPMSPTKPFVFSRGKEKNVVLWSIPNHISSLVANQEP